MRRGTYSEARHTCLGRIIRVDPAHRRRLAFDMFAATAHVRAMKLFRQARRRRRKLSSGFDNCNSENFMTTKTTPNTRENYGAGAVVRYAGRCLGCDKCITAQPCLNATGKAQPRTHTAHHG